MFCDRYSVPVSFPHFTQVSFLFPTCAQLKHKEAGCPPDPTHIPHFTQFSLLLPWPQKPQRIAGVGLEEIHFPHFTQFSFLAPKAHEKQSIARSLPAVNSFSESVTAKEAFSSAWSIERLQIPHMETLRRSEAASRNFRSFRQSFIFSSSLRINC